MKRSLVYMGPPDHIALQIHEMFRVRQLRDCLQITSPAQLGLLPLERALLMLRMQIFDPRSIQLFIKLSTRIKEFGCVVLAELYDPATIMTAREFPTLSYLNPLSELPHLLSLIQRVETCGAFNIRSHPRTEAREWVLLRLTNQKQVQAKLLDTSRMGARILIENQPLPPGPIELIRLDDSNFPVSRTLSKMVWQSIGRKERSIGLQYIAVL